MNKISQQYPNNENSFTRNSIYLSDPNQPKNPKNNRFVISKQMSK